MKDGNSQTREGLPQAAKGPAGIPLTQQWYTLDEACAVKGISSKTARNQSWLQPNGGVSDAIVGKKRRWHRDTILFWIDQTDEELSP